LLLTISVVFLATASLDSFDALIAHEYGRILLLKVAVMVSMVLVVGYTRYRRLPLMESLTEPGEIGSVLGRVVSLVKLNLGLGLGVLLFSSMLAFL